MTEEVMDGGGDSKLRDIDLSRETYDGIRRDELG